MFGLLAISLIATAVILALPPLLLGARLPRDRRLLTFLLYFVSIGAGYILIEVALIQKFVLFLGHPTYALTVIIFSMLVSSGGGSFFSRRIVGLSNLRLGVVMAAVAVSVALLALVAGPVTEAGVGWPGWLKVLLTVLMIAPPAFFMGMPLPTGLRLLELRHKPSVKWAWALNSASSVLGSVSAIFLAIYEGLHRTLLVGGGFYLVALLILVLLQRAAWQPRPQSSPGAEAPPAPANAALARADEPHQVQRVLGGGLRFDAHAARRRGRARIGKEGRRPSSTPRSAGGRSRRASGRPSSIPGARCCSPRTGRTAARPGRRASSR